MNAEDKLAQRSATAQTTDVKKFEVQYELRQRGVAIIQLSGCMNTNSVHVFWETIKEVFQKKHYRLILDCTGVTHLTSSGIGVIANAIAEAQVNNGNIVLVKPNANITRVVSLLGLSELVPLASSLNEALDNFNWWQK